MGFAVSTPTLAIGLGFGALAWWWFGSRQPERELSAWFFGSALRDPQATLLEAKACGLTGIDVMVNDASRGAFEAIGWHTFVPPDELARAVRYWKANGLRVSLTTWVMPTEDWVNGLAELSKLCRSLGCDLTADCEEPLLKRLARMGPLERVTWMQRIRKALGRYDVTCIVYTDLDALQLLLEGARSIIPQCYATLRNAGSLSPGALERTTVERFKRFGRRLVMGAAAWSLEGAYGLNETGAAKASLRASFGLGVPRVRYWHAGWMANAGGATPLGATIRDTWAALAAGRAA